MIVITTPTGHIGRQLVRDLLDGGEAVRVIARDPAKLDADVRDRVEVVPGSHGDPAVVDRAFAGADAVFWLAPPTPSAATLDAAYAGFARPACAAFRRHRVGHVVGVSALGRGWPGPAGLVTATLAMDDAIAATGVAYRALTMPGFMDNVLMQLVPIQTRGMIFGPKPADQKAPTCATRDIAAAAARLLSDRSWAGVGHVAVLGPEDLSFDDMARIMSDVLGRPIRYQQVTMDAFGAQLAGHGMTPAMVRGMVEMFRAKNEGMDNAEPRTAASTTPTTFRQWCQDVLRPAAAG